MISGFVDVTGYFTCGLVDAGCYRMKIWKKCVMNGCEIWDGHACCDCLKLNC